MSSGARIIWKYMTFTEFVALLDSQALFFCRIDKLPDRWEGVFPKKMLDYWKSIREITPSPNNLQSATVATLPRYYVNCWYKGEYESAAMWRLYSQKDEGIAIKTTVAGLINSFGTERTRIKIGDVRYIDYELWEPPAIEPGKDLPDLEEACFWKRKCFQYENELRALVVEKLDQETGLTFGIDLRKLVESIYVFPFAQDWFLDLVKAILARYGYQEIQVNRSPLGKRPW